jgi:hypothetical protein
MLSLRSRKGVVRAEIPRDLYLALIRIQASEGLDWEGTCLKAAQLLNLNSEEFKRLVRVEAQRLYKQRFMSELNKAKETVRSNAWEAGGEWVRENEDNFHVPCSICGKPMQFSSLDKNWESEIKPTLYQAFKNWRHTKCAP